MIEKVVSITADLFGIPEELILSPCRSHDIAEARMAAMFLAYRNSSLSPKEIGDFFNRERTSMNHAIKATLNLAKISENFNEKIRLAEERIRKET